ncbi:hypothetical protein L6452_21721 [Arctium lappa]|uniref:Uncharacterized protein n=1 Tax=Arctium lappa TaxID=4217 RepID=A0ACB9AY33_ARCLA|nr:hypothetical protein L6452_21721 [Arctium lappa]
MQELAKLLQSSSATEIKPSAYFHPSTSHEIMPSVPMTIEGCMWRCNRSHADGDHDAVPVASLQGDYKYAYATFEGDSDDDDADYDYAPAA